jgi:Kef-type K+ transport system membrane component KefB
VTDSEVQLLLFDIALIVVLARLLGAAAKRIGQPPVLGEIVAGILLGPTIWGTHLTATLFPATLIPPLTAIADIGLAFFMFVVGYEVDLGLIRGRERVAASVAIGSIVAPLGLGIALGVWLASREDVAHRLPFILFFGVAMSITAFPVLARILTDRGLHRTRVGGLALAAASIDDVLAWCLLAVVIAIAGASAGHNQLRLVLAPVYGLVIWFVVRPALRRLADVYQRQGRLTANVLAAVLALLLLSAAATDWMGVKFIFGAFIFGIAMPRDVPALREAILERLEQVSVLVLLPVFFVLAGINVNLRTVGLSGLADLALIMVVAVAGKFGGAYYGARLAGVRSRQAGALASLMNTRGLTELVILAIGLQLSILSQNLYSLMVVMAVVTTAMAGPLLRVIYPPKIMERDIAEADRAQLGQAAAHRIAVLIKDLETAGPLVDVGAQLAASRPNSELVLSHLVAHQSAGRLEVGSGLGGDLLQMTRTMNTLQGLAGRASAHGVTALVQSRFSDDVSSELASYVNAAEPHTIVMASGAAPAGPLGKDGTTQLAIVNRALPASPSAAVARFSRGSGGEAAVQVAAQLSVAAGVGLVLSPSGRAASSFAADLTKHGVAAKAGPEPDGAIVVGPADSDSEHDADIVVIAGSNEGSDDMELWTAALDGGPAEGAPGAAPAEAAGEGTSAR